MMHLFSISPSEQVIFAPGNLVKADNQYTVGSGSETYKFEEVSEMGQTNNGSLGYGSTPTETSARAYFQWGELATGNNTPRSFTVNGVEGWKVLTKAQWYYLLNTRTMNSRVGRYYRVTTTTLCSDGSTRLFGLLLPPDDATSSDVDGLVDNTSTDVNLSTYLAKGFVFLPAAGYYYTNSSSWRSAGSLGYYWSCTHSFDVYGCSLYFLSGYVLASNFNYKSGYFSVRLIKAAAPKEQKGVTIGEAIDHICTKVQEIAQQTEEILAIINQYKD